MPVTASPLRFPGGKAKYAKFFEKIIELNNFDNMIFVEPFAGGAGAAMTLLLEGIVREVILNDIDPKIYAFWYSLLNNSAEFLELLRTTPISVPEWRKQKRKFNSSESILELGFATFYLNRCNRGGILAANPIGGINQNSKYMISARFNKPNLERKIRRIIDLKESITLFNKDALDFMNDLKSNYSGRELLIYLDPPYIRKGKLLYYNHYNEKNHIDLRATISQCPFPWVLSYDSHPLIFRIYKEHKIRT
ncbi:DNA adenine methylase, partial [Candidatus Calescamantes bacterium]|nr:DNA adenine methylase [Candidatus Calescamantes bacterium]